MTIALLPADMQELISSNDQLHRYLLSLGTEQPHTKRSWLYEDIKDPKTILDNWLTVLDGIKNGNSFEQEVYHFDTSQLEKWGPQGGHAPMSELLPNVIEPMYEAGLKAPAFKTQEWRDAKQQTVWNLESYGLHGIRPASYKRVVDDMRARDVLESNSGWPSFARRSFLDVKRQAIHAAEHELWKTYPAIALFRNYNMKTRLVWMFPMSANLVEGSLTQPLQSTMIGESPFYSPWEGFDAVRKYITELYDKGKFLYATDFSSTDAHFTYNTSVQVEEVLVSCLATIAKPRLVDTIKNLHNIPLVISPTQMVVGTHGLASGSNWTNFLETVFDQILSHYVFYTRGFSGAYAIGDDMLWWTSRYVEDFDKQAEAFGKEVGQEINAEKVSNKPDRVKTLQRLFQRGYRRPDGLLRGVYSTIRALKSSVYPERFHKPKLWSSDMFCARQYMILENCVDHPLFEEFVKFVVKGQRDLIPFARKSKASLDRILRETKLLPGFNPTYNQERRDTSLASFQSISIARKL